MIKYYNYDIVFQEIPNETTLAVNITQCPNACKGCHSPHLQKNTGEELTKKVLSELIKKYEKSITCVCFMGGDNSPEDVFELARFVRNSNIKTAWYSGKSILPEKAYLNYLNYVKLGPYIEKLGGLNSHKTNQKLFKIEKQKNINILQEIFLTL